MTVVNSPDFVSFSEMPLLRSLTEREHRLNLLIVSAEAESDAMMERLLQLCVPPFHICELPGALELPSYGRGTVFLRDVAALTLNQQMTLFDWLDRRRGNTQVVSLTQAPLMPLVNDGRFLEGLYYRLNTVCVMASLERERRGVRLSRTV